MYVFHYNPKTGAYLGGSPADFCQLEPGRVLVPAWASAKPPPPHDTATHWPYFVPAIDAWEIRPLPVPVVAEEAAPGPAEPPTGERADALKATLQAHLDAAQRIIDVMKGEVA